MRNLQLETNNGENRTGPRGGKFSETPLTFKLILALPRRRHLRRTVSRFDDGLAKGATLSRILEAWAEVKGSGAAHATRTARFIESSSHVSAL
ncbi:hypothetical protein Kim5_PA00303 (plasmid) [Rhizobium sp. Kim5]|jgi:hypothetical protein|nr:hypothetical protein TAL182_PC00292 [Rhizobium sp. TAL182]ARQ60773.1 hypothetical protein Kim5_PA00303 [Rhizobium sp. Kim5]